MYTLAQSDEAFALRVGAFLTIAHASATDKKHTNDQLNSARLGNSNTAKRIREMWVTPQFLPAESVQTFTCVKERRYAQATRRPRGSRVFFCR